MQRLGDLKTEYPNIKDYFDTTPIKCDACVGNKVTITAEGLVLPCNFFEHNLYDARMHDRTQAPGANDLHFVNEKNHQLPLDLSNRDLYVHGLKFYCNLDLIVVFL